MSRRLTLTLLFHEEELLILQLVDVVLNLFPCTVFVCKKRVPTSLCLLDRVLKLSQFLLSISIHYAVFDKAAKKRIEEVGRREKG